MVIHACKQRNVRVLFNFQYFKIMCGRTACTLAPDDVRKACSYRNDKAKKWEKPELRDKDCCGRQYKPSMNVAPTDITPVLVSGSHFNLDCPRVLQNMMWGLVPPWHKGSYKSHGLSTNNCRLENIEKSKLYKTPFVQGKRCVVLCDGFYEWQTTKGKTKQPYFIYTPQPPDVKIEDPTTWNTELDNCQGWQGPQLLKMAAIFDSWISPEGEELLSYSIITMESNDTLSWLHHRMPAILDTEEAVDSWLDWGMVNYQESLKWLKPTTSLSWHPVSSLVNNSRNKDPQCNKPINLEEKKPESKSAGLMRSWLQRAPKLDEPDSKKQKL